MVLLPACMICLAAAARPKRNGGGKKVIRRVIDQPGDNKGDLDFLEQWRARTAGLQIDDVAQAVKRADEIHAP